MEVIPDGIESLDVAEEPLGSFEKSSEMVSYSWVLDKLSKDEGIITKRSFSTELCEHSTSWSLCLKYNPKGKVPIALILMHHGKSSFYVTPALSAMFLDRQSGKPLLVHEQRDARTFIDGDWEVYEFAIPREARFEKIVADADYHQLKLEIQIVYNALVKNMMDVLWEKVRPGPYEDLEAALEKNLGSSDLVVVAKGGKSFFVNRDVLTMRSVTFFSMYKYSKIGTSDKDCRATLRIDDAEPRVVREMLRYLYTGKANDVDEIARDLLVLAERYQIPLLKTMCEATLVKNLTVDNVCEMATLAERYRLKELQRKAADSIVDSLSENFKKSLSEPMFEKVVLGIYNSMAENP